MCYQIDIRMPKALDYIIICNGRGQGIGVCRTYVYADVARGSCVTEYV